MYVHTINVQNKFKRILKVNIKVLYKCMCCDLRLPSYNFLS